MCGGEESGAAGRVRESALSPPFSLVSSRGDASAEFRLAAFFPAPVTPMVDAMAGVCDKVKTKLVVLGSGVGMGGPTVDGLAPAGKVDEVAAARRR